MSRKPSLNPSTGVPNPDPDYAARVLSDQYSTIFTRPRPENMIDDLGDFITWGTRQ